MARLAAYVAAAVAVVAPGAVLEPAPAAVHGRQEPETARAPPPAAAHEPVVAVPAAAYARPAPAAARAPPVPAVEASAQQPASAHATVRPAATADARPAAPAAAYASGLPVVATPDAAEAAPGSVR